MAKFIDYKQAIGILVVTGFTVSLRKREQKRNSSLTPPTIIANGEAVTIGLFRDGTTWKVREESLIDWIEDERRKPFDTPEQRAEDAEVAARTAEE